MPKLGPTPPSAALLGGLKPAREKKPTKSTPKTPFRSFDGQEPIRSGDKTGNGDPTTPMEATMEAENRTEHTPHTNRKNVTDKPETTAWFRGNVGLSKSAQRDIETIMKSDLDEMAKSLEVREIVHNDIVARKSWGYAGDVLVIGGAVVVVMGLLQVTVWALGKLLGPAPMLPAGGEHMEAMPGAA